MGNILVFLVMFCFSCSISFADTEKRDEEKEKRYKKYEREENERYEFEKRRNEKAFNDMNNQDALRIVRAYETCIDPQKAKDWCVSGYGLKVAIMGIPSSCQTLRENGYKPFPKICDNLPTR